MQEITISIRIPDEAVIVVDAPEPVAPQPGSSFGPTGGGAVDEALVAEYWEFCTGNTQRLYAAMAAEELETGEAFTLDAVADRMGVSPPEVQTYNRNAGRGARLWRDRHGDEEPPIRALAEGIAPGGYRRKKVFRLPPGVAKIVARLATEGSDE